MRQRQLIGYGILVFTTLIWGSTFSVTKASLDQVPPLYYLAWRFSIAAVGLLLLNGRKLKTLRRDEGIGGVISGASMALGYVAQTVGMVYSSAAKAGFITGLAVILVPLIGAVFFRRRPHFSLFIFAPVAALGLAFLSLDFGSKLVLNRGDLYLLICAVAFAVNILNLGKYAPRCRVLMLTFIQVTFTAIACWLAALFLEDAGGFSGSIWVGLFYLAFVGTILTVAGQTRGQKSVSPERAALVFTLEPVFAALFAFVLLGERLPPRGWLGSLLIMVGIIGAEVCSKLGKKKLME